MEYGAPRETALYNLGTFLLLAGNLPEAEQTFARVLDIRPEHLRARTGIGFAQLVRGRLADALATLGAVRDEAASGPDAALLSYNLALAHQLGGSAQQALVHYLKAIQARRDLTAAHVNLGILFEGMGRPEKALTEYLKALSSDESSPELYMYLGKVYAQRGYGPMAEETIRKTTLVNPGLPAPWHAIATSLEGADTQKAVAAWRQFLETVRRDRNRAFWVPVAEKRLAALGESR
jgi:tetratricopeptide (TPR) repeat protein